MVYFINFLSGAAIPLAIGDCGAHLAAKILEQPSRRKALSIIWVLATLGVLLSALQQALVYGSDRAQSQQHAFMWEQAARDQQGLRENLTAV